jgi:NAD(P)-dependent dehydrogenase (short-subunit alcohol dehydrogenase family)
VSPSDRPVVVITGASGNVGQAIAQELAPRATLALFDRRAGSTEGLKDAARHRSFGGIDLGDEARVQAAVNDVREQLGTVHALVHTVGGYAGGTNVVDQGSEVARRMLELNYFSAISTVRAVLPQMLAAKRGHIVLFGSAAALKGFGGGSAYAASKAALLRFAESLADEVADQGIRVRVILPTTIDTPINREAMPTARFSDWVTPAEIARAVSFLIESASDGLRFAALPMGR